MIDISIFIPQLIVQGPGGLFDFNATLVIILFQFLILMVCLNEILYKPIYVVLEDRKDYVLKNVKESSKVTEKANILAFKYNKLIENLSKKINMKIASFEEIQKRALKTETQFSRNYIKNWLKEVAQDSIKEKNEILEETDSLIISLYKTIEPKLINLKPLSNM